MKGERQMKTLSAQGQIQTLNQDGKLLYEGMIRTDEKTKQPIYDGAGYLFNNETKCFFKGTWNNGDKVCGIETFPNGDVFEGPFQHGKFQGTGLLYNNVKGHYRYEGEFDQGKKHGQGTEDYINGGNYRGFFKDGVKHGEGRLNFVDKSYYMGDFQKGLPNGFGLHVATTKSRIVTIFPIKNQKASLELEEQSSPDLDDRQAIEYYYEGDFVAGYKHGIGRLYEPSGSYFYGYWEYNKPVGKTIYYNADEHNWKILCLREMVENPSLDFYQILEASDWKNIPIKGAGYPDFRVDGYKSLIDEKGLKREQIEDPEFDCLEHFIQISDDTGSFVAAPTEYKRISELEYHQASNFKLFQEEIQPGCLILSDQYSCQQLTCVLDAMTYHSFLFQKIFTRKYDSDIGFYILKFFYKNEWKEFVVDDRVPVFRQNNKPIFSNSAQNDLGWAIIFKGFAKMNQNFQYFEHCKTQEADNLLNLLTGIPCKTISLVSIFGDYQSTQDEDLINKTWKSLTEKHQKTQIRICYLRKSVSQKSSTPSNYAYHFVDFLQTHQGKSEDEDKFILMKSLKHLYSIKTEQIKDKTVQKLREKNSISVDDPRYFVIGFLEFIENFDNIVILTGTKYQVHNHQEIIPNTMDLSNNELRMFTRFCINIPSTVLFCITQASISDGNDGNLPIRIVLAKEKNFNYNKDENKQETKKALSNNIFSKRIKSQGMAKPFKYMFGRGQKKTKQIYKEVTLDTGVYILLIQVEWIDGKSQASQKLSFDKFRFFLCLHTQYLIQLQKIPQINNFQKIVYENAVIDAEKYTQNQGKELKFFSKVDLSERENGSSDLIIIQYFLKNEGTYLQYLRNRSTNKIWRQKLYFRLENMIILNQTDASKIELQLNTSDKKTELVVIQQVGAKPYNLEGGEGICIIDIQEETIIDEPVEEETNVVKKPEFNQLFNF